MKGNVVCMCVDPLRLKGNVDVIVVIIVIGLVGSLSIVEWIIIKLRQIVIEKLADEEGRASKLTYISGTCK